MSDGERPFLYPYSHRCGWAPAPGAPPPRAPWISHPALWLSNVPQSRGSDPCASMETPAGVRARAAARGRAEQPRGLGLVGARPPSAHCGGAGKRRARPPARPPHAPRARAPRPLPQVTCTRPPLCDPARWPGLSRARPAVARGCGPAPALQAPPRPRLRRPTGSQRRGERESWDAPPAEVGKLPRGGGGARRSLGFAPSAWAARPAPSA